MRRDSFERFITKRSRSKAAAARNMSAPGLAVTAEARDIAWSAPERLPVWVRRAEQDRKIVERRTGGYSPVSWFIDGLRQRLFPLAVIIGVRRRIFLNVADRPMGLV